MYRYGLQEGHFFLAFLKCALSIQKHGYTLHKQAFLMQYVSILGGDQLTFPSIVFAGNHLMHKCTELQPLSDESIVFSFLLLFINNDYHLKNHDSTEACLCSHLCSIPFSTAV